MKTEWVTKRVGDIAKTQYGISESMNEDGKGFKIFRMGEVQDGQLIDTGRMKYADISRQEFEQYKLRAGDVLFNRTNSFELVGKTGIFTLRGEYCFASYLVRLNLDRKKVMPEFLNYFMNSERFQNSVKGKASRSINQANINATILSNELIYFPESLPEQQRIVGILDEAFDGIDTAKANAEKNLQNARALFESHLNSVFTQRGPGWVDRQLASLCHEITVGHVGPMAKQYKESGVPFLRSQNIRPFEVSFEGIVFIDRAFHRSLNKSRLRPGDLAIVRTGYPGTAAVIPPELSDANCSDLVIVRPNPEVNARFLAAFFNSDFGKQLVLGRVVGAAQKHFNITTAKAVMLHVPPLREQLAIVAMVKSLREETQRLESNYQQKLAALEELKKSLLHQAFSGEL